LAFVLLFFSCRFFGRWRFFVFALVTAVFKAAFFLWALVDSFAAQLFAFAAAGRSLYPTGFGVLGVTASLQMFPPG